MGKQVEECGFGKSHMTEFAGAACREGGRRLVWVGHEYAGVIDVDAGDEAVAGGFAAQIGCQGWGHARARAFLPGRHRDSAHDAKDLIAIGMKAVVAEFEADEEIDHQAGEDAEGETNNIYRGIELVPAETAKGEEQLFFLHGSLVVAVLVPR